MWTRVCYEEPSRRFSSYKQNRCHNSRDAIRLRELEAENNELKKRLDEAHLDIHALNTAF